MWINWNDLPESMKNEQVRHYYKILKKKQGSLIVKRGFDIVASLVMLILLSWLFLILAVAIKVDSHGPVFYRQVRVTTGNRDFRIFNSRITRIGAKIRKCRLDEIPQLLNILKGEMSFVGTRPEVRKYVDRYTDEMMATLLMPAGVTSLASISFKDEDELIDEYTEKGMSVDDAYMEKVLPEKMKYNLEYMNQFGAFQDIKLMIQTFVSVIK